MGDEGVTLASRISERRRLGRRADPGISECLQGLASRHAAWDLDPWLRGWEGSELLTEKHRAEIDAILAKYPGEHRRSAVMPLLYLAQREHGRVTPKALEEIASLLDIEPTQVGSLVGFYSLFYDSPGGKYHVQVCTDLPCALRGAEAFARELCQRLGIELGGTTPDGLITVEAVMCLAACDRSPVFQIQAAAGIHYHENQTVESAMALIEMLRRGLGDG